MKQGSSKGRADSSDVVNKHFILPYLLASPTTRLNLADFSLWRPFGAWLPMADFDSLDASLEFFNADNHAKMVGRNLVQGDMVCNLIQTYTSDGTLARTRVTWTMLMRTDEIDSLNIPKSSLRMVPTAAIRDHSLVLIPTVMHKFKLPNKRP